MRKYTVFVIAGVFLLSLVIFLFLQVQNVTIAICLNKHDYRQRTDDQCLNAARIHDTWLFFTEPKTNEIQRKLVKENLGHGNNNFKRAEEYAQKWNFDINELAQETFFENIDNPILRNANYELFHRYGNQDWILSHYQDFDRLTSPNGCEKASWTEMGCFEKLHLATTYEIVTQIKPLIQLCWEIILNKRTGDLEVLYRAIHSKFGQDILSQEQMKAIAVIFFVNAINNNGSNDEDLLVGEARYQGLMPELRKYVGTQNPTLRILIDSGFLFQD